MDYSKLVAVTGMPGLYELVNSKSDGAIVRSLEDDSTKFASSRIHNFSHLESIEVYTVRDNVNLVEVFQAMEKAGGSLPDTKDSNVLKKYFENTYPDLDFERVYASDLKKMVKWFDILKKKNIEIKLSEPEEEEIEEPDSEEVEEVEEKPVKKEAKKKAAKEQPSAEKTSAKPAAAKKKAVTKKETTASAKPKKAKEETPAKKKAAPKKKK